MATITPTRTNPSTFKPKRSKGEVIVDWLTTTDHKKIGYLYLITSFLYFLLGGVMALVIRAQLALPGAIQPAVHNARHDYVAHVCNTTFRRVRERLDAGANRSS